MRFRLLGALAPACVAVAAFSPPPSTGASLDVLRARETRQERHLAPHEGTVRFFHRHPWLLRHGRATKRAVARRELRHARAHLVWRRRELAETRAEIRRKTVPTLDYWVARQIAAAEILGRESGGDPWPNCPDPFDGGGSWFATVACENRGSWFDSPGYYRCGLQFDPMWERRFGRLCP